MEQMSDFTLWSEATTSMESGDSLQGEKVDVKRVMSMFRAFVIVGCV